MVNVGGWLLLSGFFSLLLLLVQRSERSRRLITLAFVVFAASVVSGYGIYRISNDCNQVIRQLCELTSLKERARVIAVNTTNLSVFTAIVFNVMFWVFVGRYNPPGSSDDIKVLGLND